ncbi:carbonic anhydrase [Exidia glandulosa HHB12029]|uniref:Carbonic anhydrase n=1 Tax=Exidia glandulosa HHB12029 TaxID=1314781 RepID=A0A165HU05_EXIGL|nr:carbonic anhydrase [Exidia glandulosa HHB12029]
MSNYPADVEVLDAESQRNVPAVPEGARVIIVTCMDCRIDVWATFRLQPRQAHVLRNAGGRVKDAFRSIILSQHFVQPTEPGSTEVWVVHHTGCGMKGTTNADFREDLTKIYPTHEACINDIDFLPIAPGMSLEDSVRADVKWLKDQPLLREGTTVKGYIYHIPRLEAVTQESSDKRGWQQFPANLNV